MYTRIPLLPGIVASLCFLISASAQTASFAQPHARLLERIDESTTAILVGNVHPLVAAATSSTALDNATPMEHMILHLKADPTQEAQLAQLIAQQKDPKSPFYRQFLTPQTFGSQFGVAPSDIAKVTAWLQSHGFQINQIPAGNRSVVFSGTSGQVAAAFKTEIRSFSIAGVRHIANVADPQIPIALASVVGGIVQLHDFQSVHSATKLTPVSKAQLANPQYNDAIGHYLAPADFSTIYNTTPLYSAGIDGTGQSIAVVGRSNIEISDVETFRTMFGLPPNDPQILIVTNDPGTGSGNQTETTLDTEWAGAIAPKATIKIVAGKCTNSSDGVTDAELYSVNNNVAPIISVSYGLCESVMGSGYVAFVNSLWQQAAAQGQSVIVSSGDSGAAGCNSGADRSASVAGVNGLCSSPYSTCVGGTQFQEGSNPTQYWLPGNNAANGSATGYIPEAVWNESALNAGGNGLWGGGGGASIQFVKPEWQRGLGVPADGRRDVPDVSLSASQHDGYLIYEYWAGNGGLFSLGGTSFSTPAFAALVALVNQKTATRQGVVNPTLYALAAKQGSGGAAVFHDITAGNNSVPGVSGFGATAGYDLASGLGSVDAAMMVNHWTDGVADITLSAASGTLAVNAGQTIQLALTSVTSPTLNSPVTLSVVGAPAGVTSTFLPATIAAPGSGSATLSVTTAVSAKPGTYPLTITATGGGQSATLAIPVTISAPTFLLLTDKATLNLGLGASVKVAVTTSAQTGFSSALALSLSGAPSGVTAVLSASAVKAPGSGALVLSVSNVSAVPGNYPLTITGMGGGRTVNTTVALCIPTYSVTSPAGYYKTNPGSTVTIPITVTPQAGFNSSIYLYLPAYLPAGITTSFSPAATVSGNAASTTTLTLNIAKTVPIGSYPFAVNGWGSSIVQTDYMYLLVGVPASCTLWVYDSTMSSFTLPLTAGKSTTGNVLCLWPQGSFNGPLSVSFSGLPAGMTAQLIQPLLPGGTASVIQVSAPQNMAAGSYKFNITGSQGTFTTTYPVNVAVTANSFGLTSSQAALNIEKGQTGQISFAISHKGVFNSAVNLSWSGLPTGVTATLVKSSFAAPGDGTTVTSFTAAVNAVPGTYTATLSATGGGLTETVPATLVIVPPPSCTLAASVSTLRVIAGQSATTQISCGTQQGTFSSPLTLSITGAPAGVTAKLASAAMSANGTVALAVSAAQSLTASSFNLSLTATSGNFTRTVPVAVTIAASSFTLILDQTKLSVKPGSTGQTSASISHVGEFNSVVTLSWTGLPAGITAALSKSVISAPGDGIGVTTFAAAGTAKLGTYTAVLTATGGGVTQTVPLSLTIASK